MIKKTLLAFVINFLFLFAAQGAGFDCGLANGFAEKTICADKTLSELDNLLDSAYQKALDEAEQPAKVQEEQRAWIKKTRPACKTTDCLKQIYRQRMDALAAVRKFTWKTYVDKAAGIQFVYPGNRTVHVDKNNMEIRGFLMPDGTNYLIHFELGNGDFDRAVKETEIFEERKKGEWAAIIGRFENPVAEKIAGAGWNGLKTRITCGTSDEETGFHAAAGECLWALISDGRHYLAADTQGLAGLDEDTLKTLMSIQFINGAKP